METPGINNYSAYTGYDMGVKQKESAEVDKTSAEKTQSKTYGSARDFKKYLTEKYDCLRSKEYGVKINSSLLSKAMGDEKTKEWLEENLSAIPSAVEKTKAQVAARGAKILSYEISIDGYDSMSAQLCTQDEADPGTEKARKELEERLEKKREEKKAEEKKAAERAEEKRLEEHQAEKEVAEKMTTVSATGTDIKAVTDKIIIAISNPSDLSKGGALFAGFDAKA